MKLDLKRWYFSFGRADYFPYKDGWVEVHATTRREAAAKFRSRFPDRTPGVLNCSWVYSEEEWAAMDVEHDPVWAGSECWEVLK